MALARYHVWACLARAEERVMCESGSSQEHFQEMLWRAALTLLLPAVSVYIYVFFALPFFLSYHFLSPTFISIPVQTPPLTQLHQSLCRSYQTSSVGPMKVILKERWPQCLYVLHVVLIWSKASVKFVYLLFILTLEVRMRTTCILLVEGDISNQARHRTPRIPSYLVISTMGVRDVPLLFFFKI